MLPSPPPQPTTQPSPRYLSKLHAPPLHHRTDERKVYVLTITFPPQRANRRSISTASKKNHRINSVYKPSCLPLRKSHTCPHPNLHHSPHPRRGRRNPDPSHHLHAAPEHLPDPVLHALTLALGKRVIRRTPRRTIFSWVRVRARDRR